MGRKTIKIGDDVADKATHRMGTVIGKNGALFRVALNSGSNIYRTASELRHITEADLKEDNNLKVIAKNGKTVVAKKTVTKDKPKLVEPKFTKKEIEHIADAIIQSFAEYSDLTFDDSNISCGIQAVDGVQSTWESLKSIDEDIFTECIGDLRYSKQTDFEDYLEDTNKIYKSTELYKAVTALLKPRFVDSIKKSSTRTVYSTISIVEKAPADLKAALEPYRVTPFAKNPNTSNKIALYVIRH
jgi:predicted RNA-binding protein YlqC (UPF0109 family)